MTTEPELRQLRAFVAVAEELHFTRAANKLNLAQQALSLQIKNLEARLGVQLFARTTRNVELTPAGRTLLAHAVPLLTSASRAWQEVSEAGAGQAGQLSVSYPPTARAELLPRLLDEFHHRYPRLEVHTCEVWLGPEVVSRGIADIAITRGLVPTDSQILSAAISQSALGVVIGASHPLAKRKAVAADLLQTETLEISARRFSPHFYELIVGLLRSRGFAGPVHEYENLGANFLLDDRTASQEISAGHSFGVGFEKQYPYLPPDLVWRPIEPDLRVPMNICWLASARPAVKNFVAVAQEVARSSGWMLAPGATA
jgi:DNA-binding transcriptional LysR family regulator